MTPSESKIAPARLGERLAALPGIERLRAAAADLPAYLVGGAVRDLLLGSRQGGHGRRRRGRRDRAGPAPGWGGAPPRALCHRDRAPRRPRGRPGGDAQRDLPSPRRAPRGSPGAARRRPRPARLHGERDGGAAGRRSGADRSPWGPRGPAAGPAASPAPRLVRGRPHACPASRAVRRPVRIHAGAADRRALPAHGPLDGLARPEGRRAAKARRGARGRPGVRAARGVGRAGSGARRRGAGSGGRRAGRHRALARRRPSRRRGACGGAGPRSRRGA